MSPGVDVPPTDRVRRRLDKPPSRVADGCVTNIDPRRADSLRVSASSDETHAARSTATTRANINLLLAATP